MFARAFSEEFTKEAVVGALAGMALRGVFRLGLKAAKKPIRTLSALGTGLIVKDNVFKPPRIPQRRFGPRGIPLPSSPIR